MSLSFETGTVEAFEIKNLAILSKEIALAMNVGVLNILCIIPQDVIREVSV